MPNLIHELKKTGSQERVSIPVIDEHGGGDARKKFAISSALRRPNVLSCQPLRALAYLILCLTPLGAQQAPQAEIAVDVKTEELNAQPVATNWLSYNGDYTGQRFSGLEQINQTNVSQ